MNSQMQGINVILGSPLIYSQTIPSSSSLNNQNKTLNKDIQYCQIPVGANNVTYPVIPMIYPQQGVYPSQPLIIPNNIIPAQPSQIVYYQLVDGKLATLPQINFVPINQAPIAIIKNSNDCKEIQNNQNKNENSNDIPAQSMQINNFNQNENNVQIGPQFIQNQNGVIFNNNIDYSINNKNNFNEIKCKDKIQEKFNGKKETKKSEKRIIFSLNNNKNKIKQNLTINKAKKDTEKIKNIEQNIEDNINNKLQNINSTKEDLKIIQNNGEVDNYLINESQEQNQKSIFFKNENIENINEKETKTKIKYYRCSFKDCNKVFPKECNLKDHIRTHTGEKPYKCSFPGCYKSFSQHGNLKKHEKVHVGDKKYYCTYPNCGKKFSASYNLKIHYRCHTGERPYKCCFLGCQRSFYDKGNLKYHEKTMHLAESMEYPFSCEHMGCNAKFKTEREKLEHHCKMEPDCLIEREELIKLVQKYKLLMNRIIEDKKINPKQNEIISNLKKEYEEIQSKLIDSNLFTKYLGDNFESQCKNIENEPENEEEKKYVKIMEEQEKDFLGQKENGMKEGESNNNNINGISYKNDENKNENIDIK